MPFSSLWPATAYLGLLKKQCYWQRDAVTLWVANFGLSSRCLRNYSRALWHPTVVWYIRPNVWTAHLSRTRNLKAVCVPTYQTSQCNDLEGYNINIHLRDTNFVFILRSCRDINSGFAWLKLQKREFFIKDYYGRMYNLYLCKQCDWVVDQTADSNRWKSQLDSCNVCSVTNANTSETRVCVGLPMILLCTGLMLLHCFASRERPHIPLPCIYKLLSF
jgi:hypothetical protein